MLTLQKAASGTGSQNVPASPRRPVLKDKGRQRKCLCKTQTWHEYFHIQLKRYYGELKLPFFSLKKSHFLALKEPKGHVEFLKGTNGISGTAYASDYFGSGRRRYAMRPKVSFWLPDLYQCRALLNVFTVKMHISCYQWKDRRICTSTDLGHCRRTSFTSQAFPHGAQSKSNCQKFPSITKIYA